MEKYTPDQRRAFADALRSHWTEIESDEKARIADAVGGSGPSTISNWANPKYSVPGPPVLVRLEQEMGLQPGRLTWHLGWLPRGADGPACTVEVAISEDPALDMPSKESLRGVYRNLLRLAAER